MSVGFRKRDDGQCRMGTGFLGKKHKAGSDTTVEQGWAGRLLLLLLPFLLFFSFLFNLTSVRYG